MTFGWLLVALLLPGGLGCGKVGPPVRAPQYREGYVPPLDSHAGETELEEDEAEEEVMP
jgi:hypothetical protein